MPPASCLSPLRGYQTSLQESRLPHKGQPRSSKPAFPHSLARLVLQTTLQLSTAAVFLECELGRTVSKDRPPLATYPVSLPASSL